MAKKDFPQITPTARSYRPGRQRTTIFESQDGATTRVEFGGRFVNSELSMEFANVSDATATQILAHYQSCTGEDYIAFDASRGLGGMSSGLVGEMETGQTSDTLRYRYAEPPEVVSVYPGISTVRCKFIGYLRGV